MQERGDLSIATLPSTDGDRSNSQDRGERTLAVVVFLSPFLEIIGTHGVSIYQRFSIYKLYFLEIVYGLVTLDPCVYIPPVKMDAPTVFDEGDLPGP